MKCKRPLAALALHAMFFKADVVASPFGDAMPHPLLVQPHWSPNKAAHVGRQQPRRAAANHSNFRCCVDTH